MVAVKWFLAIAAVIGVFTLMIMGARNKWTQKRDDYSWFKNLKVAPMEWISSFTKIRPK